MKKVLKVFAVAMVCMLLFSACQKQPADVPTATTPTPPQSSETKPSEDKKEEVKEPEVDPKEEILKKAEEDKEAMLDVMKAVVDTYRSGTLPDYYEAYPSKESYPKLESTDDISLVKGDADSDVIINVKVGNQNMAVALKYVEGSANPWMVVKTAFGGAKG